MCPAFVNGQMSGKGLGTHTAFGRIIIEPSDKVLVNTILVKSDDDVEFFLNYFFRALHLETGEGLHPSTTKPVT